MLMADHNVVCKLILFNGAVLKIIFWEYIVLLSRDNGDIKFLTKGDNNEVDDRGLYKEGQNWLEKKDVVGRARGWAWAFKMYRQFRNQANI